MRWPQWTLRMRHNRSALNMALSSRALDKCAMTPESRPPRRQPSELRALRLRCGPHSAALSEEEKAEG